MKVSILLIILISSNIYANSNSQYMQLKNKIEEFKKNPASNLDNIYFSKVNNKISIIDDGYPTSNPASFIYI